MNDKFREIINHPVTIPTTVGVISFASGLGLGYILWNRKKGNLHVLPDRMELDLTKPDLDSMKVEPPEPVVIDAEDYAEIAYSPEPVVAEEEPEEKDEELVEETQTEEAVSYNVFSTYAASNDGWDYDEEVKNRTEDSPYILHRDEFYENEKDYTQTSLTYYQGDNIMIDEEDVPVYNFDQITGPLNFGHGSDDPNVFYVRNDKRKAEYEIIRNDSLYSVEVLGLEIENNERVRDIKHSNERRFKLDD